ncbi:MAG: hypothetical protein ACRC6T_14775 [Sarcina sp.]
MLSKVEASNLENKYFDFFSKIQKEVFIKIPPYIKSIKEIISAMVLAKVIEVDILESKLLVTMELKVKLVCLAESENLHMIDEKFLFYREVKVDEKIEGISIVNIFRSKRIEVNINTIENEVELLSTDKIYIDSQLVLSVNYKRGFSVALLMRTSEIEKNIYICFEDGRDIRQITFEANQEYTNIKWVRGKNIISYIKKELDNDVLCFYDIAENSECEILSLRSKIYSYTFIESGEIIVDCEYEDERNIYIYDFRVESICKMIRNIKNIEIINPIYRDDIDRIFFVKKNMSEIKLCSVKSNITDFDEMIILSGVEFFTKEGFDFVISFEIESIVLYDIGAKKQNKVKYPFGSFVNLKAHAISTKKNTFAIAMDSGNDVFFYVWEQRSKRFKIIKTNKKISSIGGMCFNDRGDHLMVSIEIMGIYNLYSLSLEGKCEEVLALYSYELELFDK